MWDLPTPALVLDLDALTRNLDKMAAYYRKTGVRLRPHAKTHRSPGIAAAQLKRGAAGICTAKLSEAEMMIGHGITDILITSGVVDPLRIRRLVALAGTCPGLRVVTDHAPNVDLLADAARAARVTLSVLVDLDCGAHRTGIAPGKAAVTLAERIAKRSSLRFDGFQAFGSHLMHLVDFDKRQKASLAALDGVMATRRRAEQAGLEVGIVSVGGTGTWNIDCHVEGVTDVQAGSYVFMDVMYRDIGGKRGAVFDDFEPALFVLCTAISQPVKGKITVDAGYKASATDHQAPAPWGVGKVSYKFAGDEHGVLTLERPTRDIKIGDHVLLLPGHCDPTVNLYDTYWVVSGTKIVGQWPVTGRGMSQ